MFFPCSEDAAAAAVCNPNPSTSLATASRSAQGKKAQPKHSPSNPTKVEPNPGCLRKIWVKSPPAGHVCGLSSTGSRHGAQGSWAPSPSPLHPIQLSLAAGAHLLGYGMSSTNVKCKVILTSWSSSKFSRGFFSPSNFFLSGFFHQNTLFKKNVHLELPDPRFLKATTFLYQHLSNWEKPHLSDPMHEVRYTEIPEQP